MLDCLARRVAAIPQDRLEWDGPASQLALRCEVRPGQWNADGPKQASADGVNVQQHWLPDQIAAVGCVGRIRPVRSVDLGLTSPFFLDHDNSTMPIKKPFG